MSQFTLVLQHSALRFLVRLRRFGVLSGMLAVLLAPNRVWAGPDHEANKTLSPYFFVKSTRGGVEQFPLLSTDVDVQVAGVIANVEVKQKYKNDGHSPINARYVFPASTRAAVHGLTMKLGQRVIEAKIKEREQARKEFEQAKREGKTATLLEQQRPNVFSMDLSNIMPGDQVEVSLRYTELLVPTDGVYEFVYPTVVGPRYVDEASASAPTASHNTWVHSPYAPQGSAKTTDFKIHGEISSAVPIAKCTTPSHSINASWKSPKTLNFALKSDGKDQGNRDFILQYRLKGDAIESGLSLYDQGGEKFFLAMIQPPKRVKPEAIPPREYVFVVDVSGSMYGFPLDTAKGLLLELVKDLRPVDRFNVLFFSGGSTLMAPQSVHATQENVKRAVALLESAQGGGGTELLPALKRAMQFTPDPRFSRHFVVITDGYIVAERAAFEYIRQHLGDANVHSFGIGSGVNRYLIEGIAKAGLGEPFVVTDKAQARATADRFKDYIAQPVLTQVTARFDGFDAYDVHPKSIPDVLADRPVVVFGKWRGGKSGELTLRGSYGGGKFEQKLPLKDANSSSANSALPYLWARNRISELSDFSFGNVSDSEKAQITELGLKYNLLTRYTSFIAVLHQVRNDGGLAQNVNQPLPLPQGVSNNAVGEMMGADEPPLWLLLCVACAVLGLGALWRRSAVVFGSAA